jgi:SAM-dependent methyltransferase
MSDTPNADGYVLSRTAGEYDRLVIQARFYESFTDRVLAAAGLGAGMTALDAGCGPGEVMRVMGRRVGPTGRVTGVDIDPEVGAYGLARLRAEEPGDFQFHAANLLTGDPVPGAPFDFVYCRFLLLHMDDPVAMVRRLAALTRPGGTLVMMDYVMNTLQIAPHHPVLERGIEIVNGTLAAAGRPLNAGMRLVEWSRAAGLPMPHGTDIEASLDIMGPDPMAARAIEGFGPQAVRLGLATADEIAHLPDAFRAIAAKGEHVLHRPTVTAIWTRVGG